MAEKTLDKLEEELKCPVCLETYTEPKLLPCFHVFCKKCLAKLVGDEDQPVLNCPICREPGPIPSNKRASDLQSAFQIRSLLEIMNTRKLRRMVKVTKPAL